MATTLKYFAWVRERVGTGEETLELPDTAVTVSDVIAWLSLRDEGYANAFEQREIIRVAIDQTHVGHDAVVAGAREIAFFPPVTGG